MPTCRPVLLIVAAADRDAQTYRRWCLQNIAAHYDVALICEKEPTWQRPWIIDAEVADPANEEELLAAGRALRRRHTLAGVMTWTEWYLVPAARLAHSLSLPATPASALHRCRDKAASRAAFARGQVPSALSVSVRTEAEAHEAAQRVGYPVVLKPASLAASMGVVRADTDDELPFAYGHATCAGGGKVEKTPVLVEEYLAGPEISVECVTHRGRTTAVAVTHKTVGMPPYFEELAHVVNANDPLLPRVAPAATAALETLGVTDGVSHVEMRLVDGRPRLIEVNARLAGDMIGHLVQSATGIDLARAAADIACGHTPHLTPSRNRAAAIRMIYPAYSGTLTTREIDTDFADRTDWLDQVTFQREPGTPVVLPPQGDMFTARIGFVITTGTTAAEAQARSTEAYRNLTIRVAPE
ncbi:ATP-grasp domain-containing protein [Streptomyces phytophilus]|uniref:ATP-grasp domain-containing protein n=1 Tax=Streptomyces phytophilus TaxID=722715 RepID=UPI002868215A|nr:ATP-grasp domain-containing protein [Streptomyces phytophilus]